MDMERQGAPATCGDAGCSRLDDGGYILVALLIGIAIASVWMGALLPAWRQQMTREREAELIFNGEQYARAIYFFQQKNNNNGPQNIDDLLSQHYLRRKWKDPITGDDFLLVPCGQVIPGQPVQAGATGICGVKSKSTATSVKLYQNQQEYDLWRFDSQTARLLQQQTIQKLGGAPLPVQQPGQPGRGGPAGTQPGRPGTPFPPGGPGGVNPGRGGPPQFPGQPGLPDQGPGRGIQPQPGGGTPPGPGRGRGGLE